MVELESKEQNSDEKNISESVYHLIHQNAASKNIYLDLSRKKLKEIPMEIQSLSHLEYLYLEGNLLKEIPEELFLNLPNLKWLDLRYNELLTFNALHIGNHRNIQTILLGHNKITKLPIELGFLASLTALNLSGNPIEFPPPEVVSKGVFAIINFMKSILLNRKSSGDSTDNEVRMSHLNIQEDFLPTDNISADSQCVSDGLPNSLIRTDNKIEALHPGLQSVNKASNNKQPGLSQSAKLHKPIAYYQIRQQYLEKVRPGNDKKSLMKTASEKHQELVHIYPEPPGLELIERNMLEERRRQRMKEVNEKQNAIIQKRKDEENIKQWREESKKKQREKYFEQIRKGPVQIQLESEHRVQEAPYEIKKENLHIMSSDELSQTKMENLPKVEKPKPLNPEELLQLEAQRYEQERELEERVHKHAAEMDARQNAPRGNASEDLLAAQRDLQIAQELQNQLQHQKASLMYGKTHFS